MQLPLTEPTATPPKILVVDDNPANLAALRRLLGKLPCEVVTVPSGNEALAACVRGDFALMFLDIQMPEMDGYEVAELLKDDPSTRHIPIVFVSATPSDQASRLRAYSVGAVDYIEKPLEELVVLAKASMFLDLHAAKQQLRLELVRSEIMRAAAHENEARYRQALDGAPIPVMLHAEGGEVILVNRIWRELTGYAAADISTVAAWAAKAHGGQAAEMHAQFARLYGISGIVHQGEQVVRTAYGTHLIWNFRSTPLAALPDGRRVVASMAEDITAYRRAMREQEDARQVAQHADQAKGEFLANMSHEIRTPMNAIIGLSQLVLETELTPRQQDYLLKIRSASTALLGLINDILDYSKIEAGRLELEEAPFFLEEMLQDVSGLFLPSIEQKGLELFVEVAPGTPLALIGDSLRLSQVLNNLVGNATKFTSKGEIHLRVDTVEQDGQQTVLRFSVRDTGIGLSKEKIDRLFHPFVQADSSTTRRYGGTGLGLTICRHLVELMGGRIALSSEPGVGSTFAFTVRLGIGRDRRKADRHHLQGLKALVVDDQETSLLILEHMIKSWAGEIVTMTSGAGVVEEIERAEAEGAPYEVVLLDWQMPGLNGIDVARLIDDEAAAGRIRRPPTVIMVTAFSKDRMLEEAAAVRLDGVLSKPVTPSSLFNAVLKVRNPALVDSRIEDRRLDVTPYELARPIRGASILVVEDNAINQEVAREFLQKAGLRVMLADDGRQGVAAVGRIHFDAVLMDMQMPEMDGLEATRMIRAQGHTLPIIAMTAAAMPGDKHACLEAGMNDHVSKPIVPRDLLGVLVKWIAPRAQSSEARPTAGEDGSFPTIAGIETRQASLRLAGNRALFLSLLEQMAAKFEGTVTRVREALAAAKNEDAARLLHALRGVAGNVSANDLAELASEAEAAIRDGRDDAVPDLLVRLDDGMTRLFAAIRDHLQRSRSGSRQTEAPAAALEAGALGDLAAMLDDRDAAALDRFEALSPAIAAHYGQEVAAALRATIEDLRFQEAAVILSRVVP